MINKLIMLVKKQEEIEFNKLGYKIISFRCNINGMFQRYYVTIQDTFYKEYDYLCKDVDSLYKLLKQYGLED